MPVSAFPSRRPRAARAALLVIALASLVGCLGDSTAPAPPEPFEGTWRLVRLGGQPLPRTVDGVEVVAESVTFFFTGSGFLTDRWREGSVLRECTAWLAFSLSSGSIVTRENPNQPSQGVCAPGITSRTFTLTGDTLRASGGTGFRAGALSRVYVRD